MMRVVGDPIYVDVKRSFIIRAAHICIVGRIQGEDEESSTALELFADIMPFL